MEQEANEYTNHLMVCDQRRSWIPETTEEP